MKFRTFMFLRLSIVGLLFVLLPTISVSQSMSLSVEPSTRQHNPNTFLIDGHSVTFKENYIHFFDSDKQLTGYLNYGLSPDLRSIGLLGKSIKDGRASVFSSTGDTLVSFSVPDVRRDDPSLAIYPFGNGSSVIRENITNFNVYNGFGELSDTYSAGSQSREGQTMSELAADPMMKTMLLYTPKIIRDGTEGSKAVVVNDGDMRTIFRSSDRTIESVRVARSGQFVGVLAENETGNARIHVMDRFGNPLNTLELEDDIKDFSFAPDGRFITVYSGQRVLVYAVADLEKQGSTSFRSPVVHARYLPEDHLIIALTGNYYSNSGVLKNTEIHAIHLQKREIARSSLNTSLGLNPKIPLHIVRETQFDYTLTGTSKVVNVEVSF